MQRSKKFLRLCAWLLAFAMMCTLAACGSASSSAGTPSDGSTATAGANSGDKVEISVWARDSTVKAVRAAAESFVVTVSMLTGYGFSKLKIRGKNMMLSCILCAIMIPFQALLNPLYLIMSRLGLLNSIPSMMLIYATFQTPFCTYMMKNTFDALPNALRESSMLDGASEWRIFLQIHAPLTLPSIATIAVYSAYSTWNDYLIALVFANSAKIKTFNVGLINLAVGQYGTDWGLLTAGAIVGLIPILTLFVFMQKYFVKGIMGGAVK